MSAPDGHAAAAQGLPLAGMRVLDLTRALSGPFCTMILGDLGADVIKVEPAPDGDMIRTWGPFVGEESVYYLSANRNKRSIQVNFRSPEGRALLRRMALDCDVVVENFRPGTLAAMGLDPQALRAENPELIIASISGFGADGPMANRPGFDQIAQGYSGFMSFTGTEETGPTRVGVAIGDLTSGMWTALGILSAHIARLNGGPGQVIETSLLASLVGLLSVQGQRHLTLGEVPGPSGNVHPTIAPYGVFRARNGSLNIGAATQGMWLTLCEIIGLEHLKDDPRFSYNAERMTHRNTLRDIIEERLALEDKETWVERFVAAGIPAGPINDMAAVFSDPQVLHSGLVSEVEHPTLGPLSQIGLPVGMQSIAGPARRPPPRLGQHTREILADFGLGETDIGAMLEKGTVLESATGD